MTSQEKTFEAIAKLQEIELELHRLRNALDRANKALDAQRAWTGLTDDEIEASKPTRSNDAVVWELAVEWAEAKLREKNNG
jgi:predicted  nucleic acid-binding Zn-ribbon protein